MARPHWSKRILGGFSKILLALAVVSFFAGVVLRNTNQAAYLLAIQLFAVALVTWLVIQLLRRFSRSSPEPTTKVLISPTPSQHHSRKSSPRLHWHDLILPNDVLERLQSICTVMKDLEGYQRTWGTLPPHGLLLVGPPGVGKSMSAEVMAYEAGVRFFELDASGLKVEGVWGSAEKRLQEFFSEVRGNTPAIVFIDEIDSIASKRSSDPRDGAQQAENNLRNALLLLLEQPTAASEFVLTLGGTNRPEVLDEAILSRLSVTIRFPLPNLEAREKLWQHYTKPYAKRLSVSPLELARLSAGYSGRDIANVCREAPLLAHAKKLEVVGLNEFESAMRQLSLNVKLKR
jgi:SpoVK/Ycf46/Vps4 family AAA+-type ATPase